MTKSKKLPVWAKLLIGIGGWLLGSMVIMMLLQKSAGLSMFLFISFLFIYPLVFYNLATQKKVMQIRCPNCKYEGQGKFIKKRLVWAGADTVAILDCARSYLFSMAAFKQEMDLSSMRF